jgi:prepilin-type processing-associated H-X9-DG protein
MVLLELLLVVALILLLTVLYWGGSGPTRQQRERVACQQNLLSMYRALDIYAREQRGRFPAVAGATNAETALDVLVPRYTIDTSVFICPISKDKPLPPGESFRRRKISYAYYMGRREEPPEVLVTDAQVDTLSKSKGQVVFSTTGRPPGNNHGSEGGNLLFADGRVEWCAPRASASLVLTQGVVLLNP